jgi:hypothetical protein
MSLFICGEFAGAGKTYRALEMVRSYARPLLVCNSHDQVERMERECHGTVITYAKLLSRAPVDGKWEKRGGKPFDVTPYDVVLLDEVLQIGHAMFAELLPLLRGKVVIGTGDANQTSTGAPFARYAQNPSAFFDAHLPKLFPRRLTLHGSRRLRYPERDLPRLRKLCDDL